MTLFTVIYKTYKFQDTKLSIMDEQPVKINTLKIALSWRVYSRENAYIAVLKLLTMNRKLTKTLIISTLTFCSLTMYAQFEYFNPTPDFQFSEEEKYGTGLGIADMNNDGWKDLVVANGNDIIQDRVQIYYNLGDGSFNAQPDWQSADTDYHGHLAIGDLDKNGWNDIVVSVYLGDGGFSTPGYLKIYYNDSTGIEAEPSLISESFYTFSCALGDADNDGDLDIAATAGESYNDIYQQGRIFINNNGVFTDTANWKTRDTAASYDVEFADFNRDGFSDVVFGNNGFKSRIYLTDSSGTISQEAAWQNAESNLLVNSLDVGFIDDNLYPDVVFSNNNQIGGDGKMKSYHFSDIPLPAQSAASWESGTWQYQSGVYLYDINRDNELDLVSGGWWEPVRITYGDTNDFENEPVFSTETESVVEAILFSDLGKEHIIHTADTIVVENDSASFFYVAKKPVETFTAVKHNSEMLDYEDYCLAPGKNWISTKNCIPQNDTLIIHYTYSPCADMVISNWDVQNFIYYNQISDSVNINANLTTTKNIKVFPNPANQNVMIQIPKSIDPVTLKVMTQQGNCVKTLHKLSDQVIALNIENLTKGFYILTLYSRDTIYSKKLIVD